MRAICDTLGRMTTDDLTPDERAALDALLPRDQQTGDLTQDLAGAAMESMRRRGLNTDQGGAVIAALHRRVRSWSKVVHLTGIPQRTARRWGTPPPSTND